jgi:predicted phage terminase large subunit-like protein
MRTTMPYIFSGQYQQRPTPPAGGLINTSWFERYSVRPVEFDQIIMSCDTSFKAKKNNDPSVAIVFGKYMNRWYIIHVWRKRVLYPELKRTLYSIYDSYKPEAVLIEDKASGQTLIPEMKEDGIPVIAIEPVGDKVTRMDTQAPLLEGGLVLLPERAEWLLVFEDECINFPLSTHDDQVDSLSQFLKWVRKGRDDFWSVGGEEYDDYFDDDDDY